jgi:hypothetical protein
VLGDHGPDQALILVGGAWLALHGLRDSTLDVDSVKPLDDEFRSCIETVASRHDLSPTTGRLGAPYVLR